MTRLARAISAARELAWITWCATRETALEWWDARLIDLGPETPEHDLNYLGRPNP